jgi:hypothetical protein
VDVLVGTSGKTYGTADHELSDDELKSMFSALLTEGITAFAVDPTYLVDMAENAQLLKYKKDLWAARMEVTRAVRAAVAACALHTSYVCTNNAPCGFGRCRFATPDHAAIKPMDTYGEESVRPIDASSPAYFPEAATRVLLQIRGVNVPSKRRETV